LTLLYAPYLFDSEAEADYVYDRHLTGLYRQLLAAKDLHLVTWYEIGFHHVYGIEPILVPADARGRRFRIASSLSARLFAEALGADVIPLGFGEIVPSLQTGLIEAGENSLLMYARTGIAGEAPHLTLTGHLLGMSVIVSRKAWWDGLSAEDRRILTDSFPGIAESRRVIRAQDGKDLRAAAELGFTVHPVDAEARAAWRAATASVAPALIEQIGGRSREIFAVIQQGKAEFRRRRGLGPDLTGTRAPPSR
jgi:TRAP-type C4-dicarboxylate transport system substrate-binding protein